MSRNVKFIYFAWVRERIGVQEERLDLPDDVRTGAEVITWLKGLGENYALALDDAQAIRMAVNQEHIHPSDTIGTAREIALFPPMTGG
ncbi:MAG: molybdopterin converting factor subunit 1 [Roseitalea sp.]|jgi:molybdopterin synthase sulfur carrier subunit|uniref:molybdopterin converting factor subunit 1 n=1 Tax=Oceaniradius stylonematis TaxID=2184161 RepID=UPI000F3D2966|nr:molybdopterin converting factor subunit 1 [Oceaniradius stylonematis]MBO6552939.1 molybdopterin converting factor subunit 1 [Roseitalea sp.]MBO6951301.1 molybdopterin converting factor subunit 1 [Rhizobiaceae bacterium]RNC93697.1 MAG: molybdopterin converting factor subunit 1 [Oricola sp.]MBO6590712.1 molybdopterin converting factor subunit 1 [Roseitalea sp.]MBO6600030.1 molybdopterin converting factor subunit 1 [Roseitalea sp.]